MKVVVTGGAGFIGANLCRELAGRPGVTEVVAFDDLSTGSAANLAGTAVKLVLGSILDREHLEEVLADADAVVHLAARPSVPRSLKDPVASHDVNVTGTVFVLEACRRRRLHVVAASSSSVYGSVPALPKHEDLPTRPLSPYGASKLATEAYVLAYGTAFGLPTLALRFFNVYGPLQAAGHAYAAVVPAFVAATLRGEPVRVHGDGRQTRCFAHVADVVDALLRLLDEPAAIGETFNVGSAEEISILDLARRIIGFCGSASAVRLVPYDEAYGPGFEDMLRRVPDTAKLRELTGWAPRYTLDDVLAIRDGRVRAG